MNFAFLVHPLSEETRQLLEFDQSLKRSWGQDMLSFSGQLHQSIGGTQNTPAPQKVRVLDELTDLVSATGVQTQGRLYEIPMDALAILDDPVRAMEYMQEAVDQAADWGANIVGLGSMTGIVGGQGRYLAEHAPVPVTTGNSLTVYAALDNLYHACREVDIDLAAETVAVIGIPGSIASAAARLLAPRCKSLLLVGRRRSTRAVRLADELGCELLLDIPKALRQARVVLTATSSGDCIDQKMLRCGSIITDVAVPTDVQGDKAQRDDVLILTGGLSRVPRTMPLESNYLWFHHGVIPSCLAETMVLALESRTECFSLGRKLDPQRVEEIGALARTHGFSFSQIFSFGVPLEESLLVEFRKATARRMLVGSNGRPRYPGGSMWAEGGPPTAEQLAPRAATLHARHINPVMMAVTANSDFVKTFVKGQGTELYDAAGNRYLDFVAGFGSLNLGHNHPAVVEAVKSAMLHGAPGFAQSAVNPFAAALAEQLATISPPGLEMTFFANSGTEAVEAAIKLARRATGRAELLYCERSYHGKTLGSLSVTGNPDYQSPFGPLLAGCRSVPYGDLEALERALADRQCAAFLVEPIQAEGGMHVPPPDYLTEAQRLCRKSGTLLIADEVQTGMGRTGAMFAVDHVGAEPDIITLAKSLGGGLIPIGAMLCRRHLWMKAYGTIQTFALHTSTFGGGSLACAAGLAALSALREEGLVENAAARGKQLREGLIALQDRCEAVREVRGKGLLMGMEFRPLPDSVVTHWKEVDSGGMSSYMVPNLDEMLHATPSLYTMQTMLEKHRVYMQAARSNPLVLRIQPPLTISAEEVSRFVDALTECVVDGQYAVRMINAIIGKSGVGQHQANQRGIRIDAVPRPVG